MNPEISVIILNFNTNKYTVDCVNSIFQKTSSNISFEVIVVDNGSQQEDFKKLSEKLSELSVKLIRSDINLGFSGGLQVGLNYSQGNFFFFLNNDSLLINDALSEFFHFAKSTKNVGVVGGQIFDEYSTARTSFGYQPTFSLKLFGHKFLNLIKFSNFPSRKKAYTNPVEVPLISGSGIFISKKVLTDIGGLDLNYFLYSEEEDLALRAVLKGLQNYFVPSAHYIHFQGKSSIEPTIRILEKQYRSLFYFYQKNYGERYQKAVFLLMHLIYLVKSLRKKKHLNAIKAIKKAKRSSLEDIRNEGTKRRIDSELAYEVT